jgi:DNA invertase Pin-like site-specific DNA recombinase
MYQFDTLHLVASTTARMAKNRRQGRPPVQPPEVEREHERHLDRVVQAANRLDAAKEAVREAALDAVDAGVPQTRVAEAADIGRMTLWRWLKEERNKQGGI